MKSSMRNLLGAGFGVAILLTGMSALAAKPPPWSGAAQKVPEINASSGITGVALVLGGAAVILSRRKQRRS